MKTIQDAKSTSRGNTVLGMLSSLVIVCWLACVASAMGVVYSTYEARKATQQLEQLRREASGLRVVSGQFLLEKSSWAAYARVEKIASNELHMIVPENEQTVVVKKR